ncbi:MULTISPECIES: fimbrial protein [unclassified Pseudomonas]|uniref:fimbrial protein n=1 Tax=unclassified Pseudomonas TaxID=196821 RepID=UPI0015A36A0C|nr:MULTISPECIES: fimbrial protein [unclassified Pseudomonas]NWC93106.1 fimbrial protein [Pseudomonas sp. IPO3779]NWD19524.1 fimbrial protein [Pseudomonas sp. IPO3778]
MKINGGATLLLLLALFLSESAYAVNCQAPGVQASDAKGGTFNVYVHVGPIYYGDRFVIYLGDYIQCESHSATGNASVLPPGDDLWRIQNASLSPSLVGFSGSINFFNWYDLPLMGSTASESYQTNLYNKISLMLALQFATDGAPGVTVNAGQLLATFTMASRATAGPNSAYQETLPITWNIYAQNDVSFNARGCDVSSNNMTITLPDYPGTAEIPLSIHCDQSVNISYYLTGTTTDSANTIFSNTASASPATGIGVQLSSRTGVIATNNNISLGLVGTSPVDLGMTASYARTNGQVVAGNVQSLIGVMFIYQ